MADLFTHVLVGYMIAVILSWRYGWIRYPFVAVTMAGAIIPDLNRLELLVPAASIEAVLNIPFSWVPLHQLGGTLLVICIGTLVAPKRYWRAVFALVLVGAGSHYVLDLFLYKPSGVSWALFWPLYTDGIAVDGFYLSSDRWPAAVATLGAVLVRTIDRTWMAPRGGDAGASGPQGNTE